jgi:hypothetical protein
LSLKKKKFKLRRKYLKKNILKDNLNYKSISVSSKLKNKYVYNNKKKITNKSTSKNTKN